MNAKLTLAALAATLVATPAAMAQTAGKPYSNDASRSGYEQSSPSGLPTTSPQVRSMPGAEPDPWNNRAQSGSTVGQSAGPQGTSGNTSGDAGRVVGPSGTAGSTMGNTMDPSMNRGTMGTTGQMQGNRQVLMNVDPNMQGRADRGQNRLELMQTSLLNYFSAAGFTAVRDFRKQGESYVAEAQDQNGRWTTVELDPRTGTISSLR